MRKGKIYKGGCYNVYSQHIFNSKSVEYSLDEGLTWHDVPYDIDEINHFKAWFRLK